MLGPVQSVKAAMNTIQTERFDVDYSNQLPILIVASSDSAISRAARSIEGAGARIADRVTLAAACTRIERQAGASTIWLELDRDTSSEAEVLNYVRRNVAEGRFAAVISAQAALIDPIIAGIGDADVELIIDADDAERAAALAIAAAKVRMVAAFSDIASDQNAERLRQLSDEVSRIAATLARLSTGPAQAPLRAEPAPVAAVPDISADAVRTVIRARRLRSRFFPEHLFADPAWDMLLDLLQAEIAQLRVPVSSLCIAAAVPATTALRWLKALVQQGLFVRRADPHDGRRVFVELAPEASAALRRYFAEVGNVAAI
jgi:DNA-binding MarR family transcriptional regulator